MHLIELNNIGKIYVSGDTVAVGIRSVDLSFDTGEFVAVTGASGSGKSTLLNIIAGMDSYEEGEMLIEGKATSHFSQANWEEYRRRYISFVFQDYQIIESFTVLQNVELALTDISDPKLRRQKAMELIERVGLTEFIKHKGSHLSGGQKQRTVIARALAKDSPVILADEPTGNLDSETSKEIIKLLREVSKDKLLIVVTHSIDEVKDHATRQIIIDDGKVVGDKRLGGEETVEKTSETAPKAQAGKFKSGIELGSRLFTSKPASSLITVILLFIVVSTAFFAIGFFGKYFNEFLHTADYFVHKEGRVVAIKRDSSPVTDDEVKSAAAKYAAVGSEHPDSLSNYPADQDYWYEFTALEKVDGVKNEWCLAVEKMSDKGTPDIGRYPEKDGECFVYAPVAFKDLIELKTVRIQGFEFTLTGAKFYLNNNIKGSFLVRPADYDALSDIAMISKYALSTGITDDKGEDLGVDPMVDVVWTVADETKKEKAVLHIPDKYDIDLKKIKEASFSLMQASYESSEKLFDIASDKVEYLTDDKIDKPVVYIGRDMLKNEFAEYRNSNYQQFSLFFKDDKAATEAAGKMNSDGYLALLSDAKTTILSESDFIVMVLVISLLSFIIAITIFITITVLYFATGRTIDYLKHDISIMRSMGITSGTIKIAVYTRMFIALLISLASLVVYGLTVYQLPKANRAFMYLYPSHYLLIILFMTVISVTVAYLHIRRLFSDSVRKNLREA